MNKWRFASIYFAVLGAIVLWFGNPEVFEGYKIDTINFLNHKVVIKPK